jgi:hypothetical protein
MGSSQRTFRIIKFFSVSVLILLAQIYPWPAFGRAKSEAHSSLVAETVCWETNNFLAGQRELRDVSLELIRTVATQVHTHKPSNHQVISLNKVLKL